VQLQVPGNMSTAVCSGHGRHQMLPSLGFPRSPFTISHSPIPNPQSSFGSSEPTNQPTDQSAPVWSPLCAWMSCACRYGSAHALPIKIMINSYYLGYLAGKFYFISSTFIIFTNWKAFWLKIKKPTHKY